MSTKQERAQLEELTAQVASLAALVAQVVGQPTAAPAAAPQSASTSSTVVAVDDKYRCTVCDRTFGTAARASWSKTTWMATDKSVRPYVGNNKPCYHLCKGEE